MRKYYKEGLIISSIKFISVPIITVSAAWLLGLGALGINWKLALISFVVIPLLMIFAIHFNKKMTGTFRKMFGDVAEINTPQAFDPKSNSKWQTK